MEGILAFSCSRKPLILFRETISGARTSKHYTEVCLMKKHSLPAVWVDHPKSGSSSSSTTLQKTEADGNSMRLEPELRLIYLCLLDPQKLCEMGLGREVCSLSMRDSLGLVPSTTNQEVVAHVHNSNTGEVEAGGSERFKTVLGYTVSLESA